MAVEVDDADRAVCAGEAFVSSDQDFGLWSYRLMDLSRGRVIVWSLISR
jgi:hypothetical protein